ncbi:MAG: OsmC family protein [Anaerolineales bacterium]
MTEGTVHLTWTGGQQYVGTDSGKHSIVISSHDEQNHTGMRPSDLLLLSLASCSAYDVVSILQKKRIELNSLRVSVTAEQAPDPPWTFKQINLEFTVQGKGLNQKALDQAIELSLTGYCSVAATVSGKAQLTFEGRIIDT